MATTLNPRDRLAMRKVLPSIFAQDPAFTRGKQVTNSSDKNVLDLGVLSPAGEKDYLQRIAMRKNSPVITKSEPGRIPQCSAVEQDVGVTHEPRLCRRQALHQARTPIHWTPDPPALHQSCAVG